MFNSAIIVHARFVSGHLGLRTCACGSGLKKTALSDSMAWILLLLEKGYMGRQLPTIVPFCLFYMLRKSNNLYAFGYGRGDVLFGRLAAVEASDVGP